MRKNGDLYLLNFITHRMCYKNQIFLIKQSLSNLTKARHFYMITTDTFFFG